MAAPARRCAWAVGAHASQHPGGSAGPRAVKATWVARALASNTVRALLCSRGTPLPTCARFTTRRGEHARRAVGASSSFSECHASTASRHHRHGVPTTCWRPGRASSALPRKTRVEMPLMACGCAACRRSTVKTPSVMGNAMVMVVLSSVIHVAVRSAHPNRPLSQTRVAKNRLCEMMHAQRTVLGCSDGCERAHATDCEATSLRRAMMRAARAATGRAPG
jgi:hypothetical protein